MLVRALEACFTGGSRRRKDEEFDFSGDVLPAHLVPVKKGAAVKEDPKKPEPVALSEMAKGEGKSKSFVETFAPKAKK